jgi:hypothetical protein
VRSGALRFIMEEGKTNLPPANLNVSRNMQAHKSKFKKYGCLITMTGMVNLFTQHHV